MLDLKLSLVLGSVFSAALVAASSTPKDPSNPCGVRGTWNPTSQTCSCKPGWDPKYQCDFGLNPLGDASWGQQWQALSNPNNFQPPNQPFDIRDFNSSWAFDPDNPPTLEALAKKEVGHIWGAFKSGASQCGPCNLKDAGHCKSIAGSLMIALGTYQNVYSTWNISGKPYDPWYDIYVISAGLYGSTGDFGDHSPGACDAITKWTAQMNSRLFNNPACSADKCGTTVSWDDYLAVAYPVQGEYIGEEDGRAPDRYVPFGATVDGISGVFTYDYWGHSHAWRKLSGWENLAYLFQMQIDNALGLGLDDPFFYPVGELDRWRLAMSINETDYFRKGTEGRGGTGTHFANQYWFHDQWHYLRVQIRAGWEKNGGIHPPIIPLLFYTKTMAAKTVDGVTYPVHDFFDAGTLVASKIPTDFANSWTYDGHSVLDLAFQNDDESIAILEKAGWHPGLITLLTTIAMSGFFHLEHPKYAPGCDPATSAPGACLFRDPDEPCMDYCNQDCGKYGMPKDCFAWCKANICNDDQKWDANQVLSIVGKNVDSTGKAVKWDILDRMGAINDCFFKWANQGMDPNLKEQVWRMWDAEDGTGLKQYFDRNRWLDRLLWLNEQIKHIPVTQAPTAEPIPALFTACDAAPYDMCKNQAKRDPVNTKMFLTWDGQQHAVTSACNNIPFCYSGVITPQLQGTKYKLDLYAADGTGKCGSHLTTLYKDPASKNPQFPCTEWDPAPSKVAHQHVAMYMLYENAPTSAPPTTAAPVPTPDTPAPTSSNSTAAPTTGTDAYVSVNVVDLTANPYKADEFIADLAATFNESSDCFMITDTKIEKDGASLVLMLMANLCKEHSAVDYATRLMTERNLTNSRYEIKDGAPWSPSPVAPATSSPTSSPTNTGAQAALPHLAVLVGLSIGLVML